MDSCLTFARLITRMFGRIRTSYRQQLTLLFSVCLALAIHHVVACRAYCNDNSPLSDSCCNDDRLFVISTRHLPTDLCRTPVDDVPVKIMLSQDSQWQYLTLDQYESLISPARPVVFYVHGNRMTADKVISRICQVKNYVRCFRNQQGIDWVIFSWPSSQEGLGIRDFRTKAARCDAEGIYLAWLLRRHVDAQIPLGMVAYSFGGRVATGALHVLAGGSLQGTRLPGPPTTGANVKVGLVAPALESHWLARCGYHGQATKNMERLLLLYNRRDAVLKRYWLLSKIREETALGYSGPTSFALRHDGTRLPVVSKDYSGIVKFHHSELDFYEKSQSVRYEMANLINGIQPRIAPTLRLSQAAD